MSSHPLARQVDPIPAEVQWGVVPAGRTARAEVVLCSMTGTAFEVTGVTVEPVEETICFDVHEAGEGKVVAIEASVQDDRRVEVTVHVETTGPEGRAGVTPVAVSYQGVGAPEE